MAFVNCMRAYVKSSKNKAGDIASPEPTGNAQGIESYPNGDDARMETGSAAISSWMFTVLVRGFSSKRAKNSAARVAAQS
jgi:hypothetical protein